MRARFTKLGMAYLSLALAAVGGVVYSTISAGRGIFTLPGARTCRKPFRRASDIRRPRWVCSPS